MLTKTEQTDGLYGFGAAAREKTSAQRRRNTHMLSFFVAALSTAVLAVMAVVLPIDRATASPLIDQAGNAPQHLGVAAIAAFGFSTLVCAVMLIALVFASRRSRRRRQLQSEMRLD